MKYGRSILSASIISALMFSGAALAANSPATTNSPAAVSAGSHASSRQNQTQAAQTADDAASAQNQNNGKSKKKAQVLQGVTVTGILQSQKHAIQLKRTAPDIQDSITSVSIGQLPDITIANSLSRITGVQIDRSAGEGTTINIRGLPEVNTTLNGESFLSADNIYSIQPNYETLPSSLFAGADVIKSPTASLLTSGITGTVNLRTRQPWNLPFGWTVAGNVEAGRGERAGKTKPNANILVNYNADGRWGVLFAVSHSGYVHSFANQGWTNGTGVMAGENSSSANQPSLGFLTSWNGGPVPSQIKRLPGGGVDVNGDGKSNGAFFVPPRWRPIGDIVQPKRTGVDAAFQYAFDDSLTLTTDAFITHQVKYSSQVGMYTLPVSQTAPTALPVITRDTGVVLDGPLNNGIQPGSNWNQSFFTTQAYNVWIGDVESNTTNAKDRSMSRNFNADLKFDNGGPFTGDLRWVNASADLSHNQMSFQMSDADGALWPNTLKPGVSLPPTVYVHPTDQGGNYPYNPNGFPAFAFSELVNWQGSNPTVTVPAAVQSRLAQKSTWVVKSIFGDGSVARGGMDVLRFDGHFRFDPQFKVDFGFRNNIRTASLDTYVFAARRYAGDGASDPQGCNVRWTTSDIVLNGGGIAGACTAGNQYGYFRGNTLMGPLSQLPDYVKDNIVKVVNPAETTGEVAWGLNGSAARDPWAYYNKLEDGKADRVSNPSSSWDVKLHTRTLYGQADFEGQIAGHPFRGNAGVRIIRTNLGVTKNLVGGPRPYGLPQEKTGANRINRSYTDILPAINVAINLTPKLILRLAGSKNMMPLSLDQWGGSYSRSFQITTLPNGKSVEAVTQASSSGNPYLNPWRSTNFDASLGWYINQSSMINIAAFRIRVASFIEPGGEHACNIPDQDGVIRRCVPLSEPVQGTGATLHGLEAGYRQALTFLPGFLSNTGFQVNATYAPSSQGPTKENPSGKDLAGREIPFPDNSKKSGNIVLWYQGPKLQVHLGANYRSKRAVSANYGGIVGLEVYQKPTTYVDADISYQVTPQIQIFAQGQNLTDQKQTYYLVWQDQKSTARLSERFYMLGARFHF